MDERQVNCLLDVLRSINRAELGWHNKQRGIACETLWIMGEMLIRPLVTQLNKANELHLIVPIANLFIALHWLDDGRVHPLLRPSKTAGRPRGTGASPRVRGGAAAAMEILMEHGAMTAEQAAKMVARMLDKKRIRQSGRKPIEWTTIRTWRKKILAKRPVAPRDADVFRDCLIPTAVRKIVGRSDYRTDLLEALGEPRKLAEEALVFALAHPAGLPAIWGLEDVERAN
jgi:hypothetical protein